MKVKLIVEGGAMKPGPAVAQQLGPMGINLGKVIADVNTATAGFKGTKVPVELDVDPKTKTYHIEVFSPPMAEMIKKELTLETASGAAGTSWVGNIAFESLIGIAKSKMATLPTRNLAAAVNLAVGSCVSMGILIDNKTPKEIMKEIREGKYKKMIDSEIDEPTAEKRKELAAYFGQVKNEQERKKKAADEAKAAEEAAKAAATAAAPATGAAPAAAGAKAAEPAKAVAGKAPAKAEAPKKDAKKK